MALSELCAEVKNYFCADKDKHFGTFTVTDGMIAPSFDIVDGQYYRVCGSVFNDGVHKFGDNDLTDETFNGAVWAMKVPPAVVDLSAEIDEWVAQYGATVNNPYQSESFGGYSYSKASGKAGNMTWQDAFATRLSMYRRIRL
jgi:hypothetical protein